MKITLSPDQIDDIIVNELKDAYSLEMIPNKIDCSDDVIDPDFQLLDAIEKVLSYYLSSSDFLKWKISNKKMEY
jgi:hypothetical protein